MNSLHIPQSSNKAKKLLQLKIHKGSKTTCDGWDAWLTGPLHGHSGLTTLRCIHLNKYVDNGMVNMAAMPGGLFGHRQRTRGWTNKQTCSATVTNNCARFKDAETESVHLLAEKLQPTRVPIKVDKTGFKNKTTAEIQRKPHTVRSRVLPVLLLGETVAEVFGCKSGIHINNLEHKRAALKINVMGSTPAAQGQRSKNFLFFFLHLTNEWNDTNLVSFDDSEQHLDLLWARPWGQDAGTEKEIIQTFSCLDLVLQNKRLPSWHKSQLWTFISKVTVLQVEHMYLHIAFHEVAQNRERTFKKQIQFKRNFANRFNKFTPCPQVLIRMGNAAISSQSWEFRQQC